MSKQQIVLPIVDLLTGDEIQEAMVRFILMRRGATHAEAEALCKRSHPQVSYRNVKLPDGTVSLFASVGIFSPARDDGKSTDTPLPQES